MERGGSAGPGQSTMAPAMEKDKGLACPTTMTICMYSSVSAPTLLAIGFGYCCCSTLSDGDVSHGVSLSAWAGTPIIHGGKHPPKIQQVLFELQA